MPELKENTFYINVGPLNNLNSLYYHVGSRLPELRNKVARGEDISVVFDLQNLSHERINILTLVSFLSVSRKIATTLREPINLLIKWEPNILGFLGDIGFFHIARHLKIFQWDERMVGGFNSGKLNPMTKILYFSDVQKGEWECDEEISEIKSILKQKIAPNFILRCNTILKDFNSRLVNTIANTTLELIVNSLIHGGDVAFVGLQRSSKRISISVADSGIGFKNSLAKYNKNLVSDNFDHYTALVLGSLIQKKQHGLKLAISELMKNYDGLDQMDNNNWILISSYDTEIKWKKHIWDIVNIKFDGVDVNSPFVTDYCKDIISEFPQGFVKSYNNYLVGSRITFELPLS